MGGAHEPLEPEEGVPLLLLLLLLDEEEDEDETDTPSLAFFLAWAANSFDDEAGVTGASNEGTVAPGPSDKGADAAKRNNGADEVDGNGADAAADPSSSGNFLFISLPI
jgi:hypothetical protein